MLLPELPPEGASKLEWAGALADLGRATGAFRVFRCEPDGKDPLYGEMWKAVASDDRAVVEQRWRELPRCNIGLAVQPGFMVLDADLYKPGNEERLIEFEREHGQLPATLEFNSARGGIHLIYETARDLGNGRGTLPEFGDVRGHGGYIVGPGSTFEGRPYTVERIMLPAFLPKAIDDRLVERRSAPPGSKELAPHVMLDDPANVDRFIRWLRHDARLSIEGEGGNDTLAQTGAMGSSYGLSWDMTLGLMIEHWNDRCLPPWDGDDLEKHGRSGYKSATSAFGNMATPNWRLLFEAVTEGEAPWMKLVRAKDIAGRKAPTRQWAMGTDADGWMPLGDLTLLYGPGGAGKTTIIGQMALAYARGEPVWEVPVRRMPVVLINCEDPEDELHRRFEKQGIKHDDAVMWASMIGKDGAIHPPFRRGEALVGATHTKLYLALDGILTEMGPGDKLVILDNLGQIFEGDYMDPAQIKTFLNVYVRGLLLKHAATGLILAHPSDSQKLNGEGGFGSHHWSANVRSRLYFDYVRDGKGRAIGDVRELVRKKANYTAAGDGITMKWDNGSFVKCERPAPPAKKQSAAFEAARVKVVGDAMLALLQRAPGERFSKSSLAVSVVDELGMMGFGRSTVLKLMDDVGQIGHDVAQYRTLTGRAETWQFR